MRESANQRIEVLGELSLNSDEIQALREGEAIQSGEANQPRGDECSEIIRVIPRRSPLRQAARKFISGLSNSAR